MTKRRIVVTGMGMVSPVGNTVAERFHQASSITKDPKTAGGYDRNDIPHAPVQ